MEEVRKDVGQGIGGRAYVSQNLLTHTRHPGGLSHPVFCIFHNPSRLEKRLSIPMDPGSMIANDIHGSFMRKCDAPPAYGGITELDATASCLFATAC